MAKCPNLTDLVDCNTALYPCIHGPSLQSSTVTKLSLKLAFLSVQAEVPVGKAFPSLQSLKIAEECPGLLYFRKRINRQQLGGQKAVEDYIGKVLGTPESLLGVKQLLLEIPMPNEGGFGHFNSIKPDQYALFDLLMRFRRLEGLELKTDPPYTRDRAMTFMLVSSEQSTTS